MMDVLQCNIVKQMINVLEGLVPVAKEEEKEAQSQHESLEGLKCFVSCFIFYMHI